MTKDKKFLLGETAFIFGIVLFSFVEFDLWVLFSIIALLVALIFLFNGEKIEVVFLVILFLITGLIRFELFVKTEPKEEELQSLNGQNIELNCEVAAMPEFKNGKQQIILKANNERLLKGKILVYASPYENYNYGDELSFKGTVKIPENFDDFDYRKYLRGRNIYLISYYPELDKLEANQKGYYKTFFGALYSFRKRADDNINSLLPAPAGNIVSAMTLGISSPETKEVMENFNKTGTSHVIAVSGFHMVVVTAILMFILLGIGVNRGKVFYLAALGIFCFVILSGSPASAVRSGIMAFVFLLAVKVGRGGNAFNALIFSAALMIFLNPYILSSDVGFQLSFLATFGLIVILPVLENKLKRLPELGGIKKIFLTTLAAQIAVFPILIMNFGQFSLLSFVANILILPTVPLLMIGGFLLIGVSFFSIFAAKIIALPVYFLVSYEIAIVDILSRTDWGLIKF